MEQCNKGENRVISGAKYRAISGVPCRVESSVIIRAGA